MKAGYKREDIDYVFNQQSHEEEGGVIMSSAPKKLLSRVLIFACLVFVVSGAVYAEEWAEYSNQDFSLDYPADWEIEEYGTEVYFYDGFELALMVEVVESGHGLFFGFDTSGLDADEFVEQLTEEIEAEGPMYSEYAELLVEEREIAGQRALETIMKEDQVSDQLMEIYWNLDLLVADGLEVASNYFSDYGQEVFVEDITLEELADLEESLLDLRIGDVASNKISTVVTLLEDLDEVLATDNLDQYYVYRNIITLYDEQIFFVDYHGEEEEYEVMKSVIEQVVESIEFN